MRQRSFTLVIGLATSLIAMGMLAELRSSAFMLEIQALTRLLPDDLWKSLNIFGHILGAACILLMITRKIFVVWALAFAALLGGIVSRVLKLMIDAPRPAALIQDDLYTIGEKLSHGSMPSGHSMTVAIVLGLYLGLYPRFGPRVQRLGVLLGVLVALVCLARVASGAHWPADVLVGAGLGLLIGLLCAYLILRWESRLPRYEAFNQSCRLLVASALILVPLPPSCSVEASVALGLSLATWHFLQRYPNVRPWSPNLRSTRQH